MKKILLLIPFLLTFLLNSCGGGSFFSESKLLDELKLSRLPVQEDYPNEDAVMLMETHDMTMEITSDYDVISRETVHKTMKLFKNIEDYADVELYLGNGEEIDYINARTIKPDGSVVELNQKDIYNSTGLSGGSTFHSDIRSVKFTFPAIEKNCIIEYEYLVKKDFPFERDVWIIQNTYPTLLNRYNLTVPALLLAPRNQGGAGWNWRYQYYNIELPEPKVSENINPQQMLKSKTLNYTWELKNIKSFEEEPNMPSWRRYMQYVRFAPSDWQSWNDISEWYHKYFFKHQLVISDEVKKKAAELTQNCSSEQDKIKKLYNYVQNLRYVSVSLGDGSIRPTKPDEVLKREYGDCKDKSTLLIAMLNASDIKAKPVLMLTSDRGWFDSMFPSWNFNHMIVKVEPESGKPIWLDPTSKYCPVGMLPPACEGIEALVIDNEGKSKIERTYSSSYKDNLTQMNVDVSYENGTTAIFDVKYQFTGQRNVNYRYFLTDKSDEDMKKFCKTLIEDDYLKAEVLEYSFSELDSLDVPFNFSFKFKVPDAVQMQGDLALIDVDPFKLFSDMNWISKESRIYNIEFNYPMKIEKKFSINIPGSNFTLRNLPESVSINGKSITYKKNFSQSEDKILAEEVFELKTKEIPVRDYTQIRESFDKIQKKMKEKLILTKNN